MTALPVHVPTIVVGAGPAGVMAARLASERGPVMLIDSSVLPRDKSCGGMLNEYTQRFVEAYGELPDSMWLEPAWVNFRFNDRDRGITKTTDLRFANVERRAFDDWLMSLLPEQVTVRDSTTLTGLVQDENGVTVTLARNGSEAVVRCDHLIGCDGPRSSTRRSLGVKAVSNYVTLQDFCVLTGPIDPVFDCIYLRGIGDSFAYAYVVPKGDVAIVGSVFYPRTKRPHEKQEQVLSKLRETLPLGESRKREAWSAIHVRHHTDVVAGHGRVLLAGEAGGFMSPTSGEGISYALNTGRMAGTAVRDASAGAGTDALDRYMRATRSIRKNIARKLWWLPVMESSLGKHLAAYVPDSIISKITQGL